MKNSRRKLTPEFKTKVSLAALKNEKSTGELAKDFNIHPSQISTWKSELMNNASSILVQERIKIKKKKLVNRRWKPCILRLVNYKSKLIF